MSDGELPKDESPRPRAAAHRQF